MFPLSKREVRFVQDAGKRRENDLAAKLEEKFFRDHLATDFERQLLDAVQVRPNDRRSRRSIPWQNNPYWTGQTDEKWFRYVRDTSSHRLAFPFQCCEADEVVECVRWTWSDKRDNTHEARNTPMLRYDKLWEMGYRWGLTGDLTIVSSPAQLGKLRCNNPYEYCDERLVRL